MDFWQTTALLVLIACSIGIGFAIGCADRKWWRGPKPPSDENALPNFTSVIELDGRETLVVSLNEAAITKITNAIDNRMSERAETQGQALSKAIGDAIDTKIPGKTEFAEMVASMIKLTAETLKAGRQQSGKRIRRGRA